MILAVVPMGTQRGDSGVETSWGVLRMPSQTSESYLPIIRAAMPGQTVVAFPRLYKGLPGPGCDSRVGPP